MRAQHLWHAASRGRLHPGLLFIAALLASVAQTSPAASDSPTSVPENLVETGRRIYREGRPADGPLRAVLVGGTAVEGPAFACAQCHRRSGLGGSEGNTGTRPVTGALLYETRPFGYAARLAYSDETLARAIRSGIDSGGEPLRPPMPQYELSDRDMAGLIAYLKTLSTELSPGVTDTEMHFATVVAGDVEVTSQRAMLDVLETYFHEKNAGTRNEVRRARSGPFHHDHKNEAYRKLMLHTWRLTGAPETWDAQLTARYAVQPVFAIVSGISAGPWAPVHTFCERQEIPCLLPNTDTVPVTSGNSFYTIYFSQGVGLEARAIASDAAGRASPATALQIFRPHGASAEAARAFRQAVGAVEGMAAEDWALDPGHGLDAARLAARVKATGARVVILWLGKEDLSGLEALPGRTTVYLSSTLLGDEIAEVPDPRRSGALLAHPYTLPGERTKRFRRVGAWLKSRKIELTHPRIQAQTHFACLVVAEGLMHIRTFFYRDYFMDSLEHAEGIANFSAFYPRLSFGPGQRYLAKGSYIVTLGNGQDAGLIREASWLVPEP
jgi:mono/diheme cytochrome c family protein